MILAAVIPPELRIPPGRKYTSCPGVWAAAPTVPPEFELNNELTGVFCAAAMPWGVDQAGSCGSVTPASYSDILDLAPFQGTCFWTASCTSEGFIPWFCRNC